MSQAKRHIHKYQRITVSSDKVWSCGLSDCTHFMPKHMENLVKGKKSICWSCGEYLIMDDDNMQFTRPVCMKCAQKGKFFPDSKENKIEGFVSDDVTNDDEVTDDGSVDVVHDLPLLTSDDLENALAKISKSSNK